MSDIKRSRESTNEHEDLKEDSNETKQHAEMETPHDEITLELIVRSNLYEINVKKRTFVSTLSNDIDKLISAISKAKSLSAKEEPFIRAEPLQVPSRHAEDNPVRSLARALGLDEDAFEKLKLIAIKNENIQLLKPSLLKPSENCYLLLAANEFVLHRNSLPYDEWKELCEASSIKSNTTFNHIANNAKNYGHIDKKKYDNSKELTLKPKGVEVVRKAIQSIIDRA